MKNRKFWNFIFLFAACIIGTAIILSFAIGIENGHPLSNRILKSALNLKVWVFVVAILVGVLAWIYKNGNS